MILNHRYFKEARNTILEYSYIVAIIAFALIITGCDFKAREQLSMAKSEAACHNHNGVQIYGNFILKATCKDGARVEIDGEQGVLVAEYLKKAATMNNIKYIENEKEKN